MRGHGSGPGGRGGLIGRPRRKRKRTKEKKASTSDENEEYIVASSMRSKPQPVTDDPRPSSEQFAFSAHPVAPCTSSASFYHTLPFISFFQEELEVPYDITFYQRRSDQRAPNELRNIHPLGRSPVITDGEITLAESGAIIRVSYTTFGRSYRS